MTHFLRGFIILVKLTFLLAVAIVLAQYPGEAHLSWFGYKIHTTMGIVAAAVLMTVAAILLLAGIWRFFWRLPLKWAESRRRRRQRKGEAVLLEGINAVAAAEYADAGQMAKRARALNPSHPLSLLLSAQSAFMTGNGEEARTFFRQMTKRSETLFLGLRGLILQARRSNNWEEMQGYLQEALKARPGSPWVLEQLLEMDLRLGALNKASIVVEQMQIRQLITRQESRRRQGLIHWLKAEAADKAGDDTLFIQAAASAHYEAPEISAIAVRLAERYQKTGKASKAQKLLMSAYGYCPHPDFGKTLSITNARRSPLDQYREIEKMVGNATTHPESLYILANAARSAKLWGQSRHFLMLLKDQLYTQRVCRLMAELEEAENPHQPDLAREWWEKAAQAPADPAWICQGCHTTVSNWHPLCPSCEAFDRVTWQLPANPLKTEPKEEMHLLA